VGQVAATKRKVEILELAAEVGRGNDCTADPIVCLAREVNKRAGPMAEPLNYLQWYGASAAGGAFGQLAAEVVSSGAFDTAANGLKNVAQSLQDSSVTAARAIEAWKPGDSRSNGFW
jgi:hypothetical protein